MEKNELVRIYDMYFRMVYKVCFLYMKNHADAQDMTQETFCQMLRKPIRYETEEKTKAWLIVTASNLCKNQLKKWWFKRRVSFDDSVGTLEKNIGDMERHSFVGANESEYSEVYASVMGLEEKYAIPTYLYYYEGYKTAEIAEMLHEKQSTIQTRLAKARQLLKLELTE